jgi:hypothetical protein
MGPTPSTTGCNGDSGGPLLAERPCLRRGGNNTVVGFHHRSKVDVAGGGCWALVGVTLGAQKSPVVGCLPPGTYFKHNRRFCR